MSKGWSHWSITRKLQFIFTLAGTAAPLYAYGSLILPATGPDWEGACWPVGITISLAINDKIPTPFGVGCRVMLALNSASMSLLLSVSSQNGPRTTVALVETARNAGVTVSSLSVQSTTLDDVFVHFTGHQLRDTLQSAAGFDPASCTTEDSCCL
jgi:hypothetical protein